ncbi:ABC transporter substrate-binding protein [Brevibacillus fulvus]|uniref:Polar amino acid transport system substrate-binding protein n=1 Tax=Brevibacillus fulvus TaxID=1125967 RepID=A0A938Y3Z5_9BACL|nr:polar amino acid transport system substrate-binding protein [Brevibacillus fulvus]
MKAVRSFFWSGLLLVGLVVSGCGSTASVDSQGDFTFAMSGLYPPFNYQENGELVGFDVEIGNALAKKMGMNPKPVTNPWQTILAALNTDKFQAIIGSMAITDERKKEVDFSEPYYESGAQIFVAKGQTAISSTDDLQGKKIGVVVSSTFEAVAKKYSDQVQTYDSDVTALQDLLVPGRLDAVITDELVGKYAITKNKLAIQPVGEPLYLDQMGIPVKKGNAALLNKINKALQEIKEDGTYAEISKKYFGENIAE